MVIRLLDAGFRPRGGGQANPSAQSPNREEPSRRTDRKSVREKLRSGVCVVTVPNLTQEDEASSLRRSREPYVKELGKLTP